MGLFPKKKGVRDSQTSPLSEAEIHRRLYGEFETGTSHTVLGDRDHLKGPDAPVAPSAESGPDRDLFNSPSEPLIEPGTPKRARPEVKSSENPSRYVPLHEFEKKAGVASDPVETYERFRSGASSGKMKHGVFTAVSWILVQGRKFSNGLLDPGNVLMKRALYWGAAVVVVFLLFWGVNVLNSQREVAMKAPYKSHKELPPASAMSKPARETLLPASRAVVAERPVVITPAPTRPREREVVITPAPPPKHKGTPANPSAPYAIQVVTYPSQADALKVVETFKNNQLNAFVKENKRPSGRVFYVVFIGGYRTEAEAQAQLVKFRAKEVARPFQDAFVKTI